MNIKDLEEFEKKFLPNYKPLESDFEHADRCKELLFSSDMKDFIIRDRRNTIKMVLEMLPNKCSNQNCPTIGRYAQEMCPCRIAAQDELKSKLNKLIE